MNVILLLEVLIVVAFANVMILLLHHLLHPVVLVPETLVEAASHVDREPIVLMILLMNVILLMAVLIAVVPVNVMSVLPLLQLALVKEIFVEAFPMFYAGRERHVLMILVMNVILIMVVLIVLVYANAIVLRMLIIHLHPLHHKE